MPKIIKLTESDLNRIVKRVIQEQIIENPINDFVMSILNGGSNASEKVKQVINSCAKSKYPITPRTNKLADSVYDAIQGFGTDETMVYKTMSMARTLDEFCGVVKSYRSSYNQDLYSALDGDFDSETEWVQIMRPLRDIALKSQQLQKSKTAQQRPQTTGGAPGGKPIPNQRPQTTGGAGRPIPNQRPQTTGGAGTPIPNQRPQTTGGAPGGRPIPNQRPQTTGGAGRPTGQPQATRPPVPKRP